MQLTQPSTSDCGKSRHNSQDVVVGYINCITSWGEMREGRTCCDRPYVATYPPNEVSRACDRYSGDGASPSCVT